jgi:zinc transporter ZupT
VIADPLAGWNSGEGHPHTEQLLSQGGDAPRARRWLPIDAVAPEVGALAGAAVPLAAHTRGIGMAIYAGIFLMIGAGELLPAAHSEPSPARLSPTAAGALLIFLITGPVPN